MKPLQVTAPGGKRLEVRLDPPIHFEVRVSGETRNLGEHPDAIVTCSWVYNQLLRDEWGVTDLAELVAPWSDRSQELAREQEP